MKRWHPERRGATASRSARELVRTALPARNAAAAAPSERRHPLRFVWQMDEAGRFTLGSDEFVALIGPRTAAVLGRAWQEIATELGLDPEGRIAQAIATHETWSGLTVGWPVDDGAERLAVELSGLPVFDRARQFRGYRGFGVCRDLARIADLAQRRSAVASLPDTVAEAGEAPPTPRGRGAGPGARRAGRERRALSLRAAEPTRRP